MTSKDMLSGFISAVLAIGSSVALAEQPKVTAPIIGKKQAAALESTATTSEDHLRLAVFYRAQTRKLEERVRYHREMAEWYRQRPLPYDGKMAVPMRRHCKDWASRFAEQAERAAVLASFHEEKALGPGAVNPLEKSTGSGLLSTGFAAINTRVRLIEPTPKQTALYRKSVSISTRFYDRARILTYVVSAKGQAPVDIRELRESAAELFDTQQEFLQSLSEVQKVAVAPNLRDIDTARREIEKALIRLDGTILPAKKSYFNSAKKIKQNLERWHNNEQQIGIALGLDGQA